jgi:hypothetical protein
VTVADDAPIVTGCQATPPCRICAAVNVISEAGDASSPAVPDALVLAFCSCPGEPPEHPIDSVSTTAITAVRDRTP